MKKTFNSIISNFNYRYALILPVLYYLIVSVLHSNAEYSIMKSGILYLVYEENFFRILLGFLLILNFILFAFYRTKITRGNESFKFFNLTTNALARKLTINFTIITTVIFLLSVVSLTLANCSRYEADSESLKKYNYRFLNRRKVPETSKYYVEDFVYSQDGNVIVSIPLPAVTVSSDLQSVKQYVPIYFTDSGIFSSRAFSIRADL